MPRKNKFKPGKTIRTADALMKAMTEDEWVYMRHKPYHYGFIQSMPFRTVTHALYSGAFRKALKND